MKKIVLSLFAIGLLSAIVVSCQKEQNFQPQNSSSENNFVQKALDASKPKIKFKHTKMHIPGQPYPPSCGEPLGLCITSSLVAVDKNYEFTEEERAEGYGTALMVMTGRRQLKLTPDTEFAYPDGTIEIQDNGFIDPKLANELGFRSIELVKGTYRVNPSEGEFGSVVIQVNTKQ
ncbi:MAG: hypothetical protein JNL24_06860 [Bacteroidia bacterium]|nr:hypothetical protein [Bacteroidia bacterium]